MLHALLNNNKLIGIYSDYDKCTQMMNGLLNNNFVHKNKILIKTYYENSITIGVYKKNMTNNIINTMIVKYGSNMRRSLL